MSSRCNCKYRVNARLRLEIGAYKRRVRALLKNLMLSEQSQRRYLVRRGRRTGRCDVTTGLPFIFGLGVLSGLGVWRLQRKRGHRHSLYDETPAGMTAEAFNRRQKLRNGLKRVFISVACAALIIVIGFAFLQR
jgi:hypothetical protein